MKKIFALILCILPLFSLCQNHLVAEKPVFNAAQNNLPEKYKLQDLKFKTQNFISENLDQAFVKKFLPVGDTIEFNIQYTINKSGIVKPDDIFINTEVDFFNLKIKSVLAKLPKFTPATGIGSNRNINYTLNFTPEFHVNKLNRIVPIYRYDFPNISLNIYDDETELFEFAKSLGYDIKSNNKITNVVHFRTDDNLNITDIRIFTENQILSKKISPYLNNLKVNNVSLHNQLKKNTNYITFTYLFLRKKIIDVKKFPIYPGCEKKITNDEIKKCFNEKLNSFIYKKFDTRVLQVLRKPGAYQIKVIFKIDTLGSSREIKVLAPNPKIVNEAKRVIKLLPKMLKPGYDENDKAINVPLFLPIRFKIEKNRPPVFNPYDDRNF